MIKEIVVYPDPRLRERCTPIRDVLAFAKLYEDLIDTMYANDGVGLAANQIGEFLQAFVLNVPHVSVSAETGNLIIFESPDATNTQHPLIFINPEITERSAAKNVDQEGCLSFPGVFAPISRHVTVTCKAIAPDGSAFTVEAHQLYARAIQHEVDHLSGQLMIDLVGSVKREMIKNKIKKKGK